MAEPARIPAKPIFVHSMTVSPRPTAPTLTAHPMAGHVTSGRWGRARPGSSLKELGESRVFGDRGLGFFASRQTRRNGVGGPRLARSATAKRPVGALGPGAGSADD